MSKNFLKITPTKAVVQIIGAGATIALATDLLFAGQTVSGTPTVNITGIKFSCQPSENITVTRNSVVVLSVAGVNKMDFSNFSIPTDNTYDLVVACPANGMLIIELNKTAGYTAVIPNTGINDAFVGP